MARGEGSHIWDVDGNEYIDWWMTHFAKILGHAHPSVIAAIREQLENGVHLGALNEAQVELAELLRRAIPLLEKMRFCTTGAEATMYATRLARLYTGRHLVAKARGGWHGGNDSLVYHLKYPFTDEPIFAGLSFDFNDSDSVTELFREHGEELAAVIVEPVLGAGGGLPPERDFLRHLREQCDAHGSVLIFDEIITGFRLCYGSAGVELFGVRPDLMTLGKIVGGGMPIGIYGGREEIMRLAEPGAKGGRWVGGGTFSSHPLSMAAGVAVIRELERLKNDYRRLNTTGDTFRRNINTYFSDEGIKALSTGTGSIAFVNWLRHDIEPPLTATKLGEAADHKRLDLFQSLLFEQGVFGFHGLGAISFAHTKEDISRTLDVAREVAPIVQAYDQ